MPISGMKSIFHGLLQKPVDCWRGRQHFLRRPIQTAFRLPTGKEDRDNSYPTKLSSTKHQEIAKKLSTIVSEIEGKEQQADKILRNLKN